MNEGPECSRRQVLRAGVVAGTAGAALGSAGCAGGWGVGQEPRAPTAPLSSAELAAFLERFDRGLFLIERSRFVTRFAERRGLSSKTDQQKQGLERADAEFCDMLSALFAAQSFRELPFESQLHPEVQRRMLGRMRSIDRSVRRMTRRLRELSPAEREIFHQALRERPDLSLAISEAVNQEAASVGVPPALRRHFRAMMTQVAFRIKSQGPTRALDEVTAHLTRVSAPGGVHHQEAVRLSVGDPEPFLGAAGALALERTALLRDLELRSGWVERWAADPATMNERLAAAARREAPTRPSRATRALRTAASQPQAPGQTYSQRALRKRKKDRRMILIGAILLGVGLMVGASGVALVGSVGLGGAFMVTPGALAAATGFVLLLVGAARLGNAP